MRVTRPCKAPRYWGATHPWQRGQELHRCLDQCKPAESEWARGQALDSELLDTAAEISKEQDKSLFDFLHQKDLERILRTASALSVQSTGRSAKEMARGEENVSEEMKKLMLTLKNAAAKLQTRINSYDLRKYPGNVLMIKKISGEEESANDNDDHEDKSGTYLKLETLQQTQKTFQRWLPWRDFNHTIIFIILCIYWAINWEEGSINPLQFRAQCNDFVLALRIECGIDVSWPAVAIAQAQAAVTRVCLVLPILRERSVKWNNFLFITSRPCSEGSCKKSTWHRRVSSPSFGFIWVSLSLVLSPDQFY